MSGNIFAELQMMSMTDDSIPKYRKDLNRLVSFMRGLPFQQEQIAYMGLERELPTSILNDAEGFMVLDDMAVNMIPEEFHHDSYGFIQGTRLIYSGRFTFPIKDTHGDVAGFVGYDKYAPEYNAPKYLDSKNYGYLAKNTMFFGMENLPKYYEDGYVIDVEGSMCALWLRANGFNSLSQLGSYIPPYIAAVLRRFGRRCIIIPDADEAGNHFKRSAQRLIPEARVVQSIIAKDVDDSRKVADIREDIAGMIASPFYTPKYFR